MSARDWARAIETTQRLKHGARTLPQIVLAASHGDAPALIGPDGTLSHAALAAQARRYTQWAIGVGIAPGGVVALHMPSCPDYVAIWLGLSRIGIVVALLNTQLPPAALAHCLRAAGAMGVITTASFADQARAAIQHTAITLWLDPDVAGQPASQHIGVPDATPSDRALLIYTSGTTGMPKAAHVTHARIVEWSGWFAGLIDARADDRLYDCLPLYHSTGGVVAVGCMLLAGGAVVLRPRFSARDFWADVADSGCTIVQYIGELCRYLLQTPPGPQDRAHRLRLATGNGLHGAIWPAFQQRFAIPRILEFYAATEGSVSLYNTEGRPGAIGRVPPFLATSFPVALVRLGEDGDPLRDTAGLCLPCGPDEPGEALGKIGAGRDFDGYTDDHATARKILHDVFAPGDRWFRTGDLMRRDAAGYYYFLDRLGDTFRWKGENVSTTEVAAVVLSCPGVLDAVAFGVAIPGAEGRAGMAAIVPDERFNLAALHAHLAANLPSYARPVLLRLCRSIDRTGTFKLSPARLRAQSYLQTGADPLWWNDRALGFIPYEPSCLSGL